MIRELTGSYKKCMGKLGSRVSETRLLQIALLLVWDGVVRWGEARQAQVGGDLHDSRITVTEILHDSNLSSTSNCTRAE